jgi:hypothetical protein
MNKWTLFVYQNGSNPYIAKTEEEKNRILKKYKGKVEKIEENRYLVKE